MDYETSVVLKRLQIREISNFIRKLFHVKGILFPVMKVLELLVTKFENNIYYTVEEDKLFDKKVMAELVDQGDGKHFYIRIRESVYESAIAGDGASLGYICHEICHFLLIYVFDIGPKKYITSDGMIYAKAVGENSLPPFKSMEWQAKALCGELMIPFEECKNWSLDKIIKETNSSREQAQYFIDHVAKGEEE